MPISGLKEFETFKSLPVEKKLQLYTELLENANDIVYTHDLNGNFTSLNNAAKSILGYTENDAVELNINISGRLPEIIAHPGQIQGEFTRVEVILPAKGEENKKESGHGWTQINTDKEQKKD